MATHKRTITYNLMSQPVDINYWLVEQPVYSSGRVGIRSGTNYLVRRVSYGQFGRVTDYRTTYAGLTTRIIGRKQYELTDHLGNVRIVFDNRITGGMQTNTLKPNILATNSYYPYGMLIKSLSQNSEVYRWGFQGHEQDNEIKGIGNHLRFGDYGYDTRLGRRWNLDPVDQISISNYAVFRNNPVNVIDPDGEFPIFPRIHQQMVATAFNNSSLPRGTIKQLQTGAGRTADITYMNTTSVHMDDMEGTFTISSAFNKSKNDFTNNMTKGNYTEAGVALHTISDFYAHSNYIPMYKEYVEKSEGKLSDNINDIPTFTDAMKDENLMKFIESKGGLRTGTYEGPWHDSTTTDPKAHGNMNLDSNRSKLGEQPYNKNATMHEAAKAAAQKELNQIAQPY